MEQVSHIFRVRISTSHGRRTATLSRSNLLPNIPSRVLQVNEKVPSLSNNKAAYQVTEKYPVDAKVHYARETKVATFASSLVPKRYHVDNKVHHARLVAKSATSATLSDGPHLPTEAGTPLDDFTPTQNLEPPLCFSIKTAPNAKGNAEENVRVCEEAGKGPTNDEINDSIIANFEDDCDSDLSDEFIPKKKSRSTIDGSCSSHTLDKRKVRKKPGVRMMENELANLVLKAEEESLANESFMKVHEVLPSCAMYVVTNCELVRNSENNQGWKATLRAAIDNKVQALQWLAEFATLNYLDYRVLKTSKGNSERLVFKRQYRCHHNTRFRKNEAERIRPTKNTDCPAFVRITIKQKTMKWSADVLLQSYPCEIVLNHFHNHRIFASKPLRSRRPSEETKTKFLNLLKSGHSPLSAIETHRFDLHTKFGDDYFKVAEDAAINPSIFWVYKLYKKMSLEKYGPQTGNDMIEAMKKLSAEYNEECKSECCKVEIVHETDLIVAVCSPLMKRVHKFLPSSGEMMFIDSSGTMDFLNCKVFLLLTSSVAGGLPLGVLIVSSESEKVLKSALELWKTLLPDDAFYGEGPSGGPKLIMTDDSTSERNSLRAVFVSAILLLCLFHILQAFWRYVWDREQNVKMEDRSVLFFLFKDMVYAESEENFKERLKDAMFNSTLAKYPAVRKHIQKLVERSPEWALYFREDLLTRGHNTNNLSEANIRIIKDKVLGRLKAFNPVQLLDFLLTRYNSYLERRLVDIVNDRAINSFKSRFFVRKEKLEKLECIKLPSPPNTFQVTNLKKKEKPKYIVVMDFEICSCPKGKGGAPCKHLCAVVQTFNLSSSQIHPLLQCKNPKMKLTLFEIVYGHRNIPDGWFSNLQDDIDDANLPECIDKPDTDPAVAVPLNVDQQDTSGNCQESLLTSVPHENIVSTTNSLAEIFNHWKEKLNNKPDIFLKPLTNLFTKIRNLKIWMLHWCLRCTLLENRLDCHP